MTTRWPTLLLALIGCGDARPAPARRLTATLCRLDDVTRASRIRYAGYAVGGVDDIAAETTGTRVRYRLSLEVSHPDAPLRRGDHLQVTTTGPFTADALDIVQGPRDAPRLADGDTIAVRPRLATSAQRHAAVRLVTTLAGAPTVADLVPPGSLAPDTSCAEP